MRKKKWIRTLTALAMSVTLLAGCGGTNQPAAGASNETAVAGSDQAAEKQTAAESTGPDISKEVELVMYCIGDEGSIYADDALKNLNTILKEKINATIKPVMVSWGEYKEKMPLIYASGEAYDLTYVANWINYSTEALKGPFLELTGLMQEYAPKTYAELEESGALEMAKVNGQLFMVPSTEPDYTMYTVVWREDLRKKHNLPEITDWESLETYMEGIRENEPDMMPMAMGNQTFLQSVMLNENDWGRPGADGVITYKLTEGTEYFSMVDTPEYLEMIERNRRWYEKGYWSRNVLSETTSINDAFKAGRSATAFQNKGNLLGLFKEIGVNNPDWELGYANFEGGVYEKVAPTNNGMAIGINSRNPERAMMFLELMNQDEEAYRAMYYGIEGTTYVITEDGRKSNPEGVDPASLAMRNLGMGMQVEKFILDDADADEDVLAYFDTYEENSAYPALAAFAVDNTNISAELAAIANVNKEYKIPLELGTVDPETGMAELKEKLKQAGIDKVLEEMNRQLAEFNAAKTAE